MYRAWQGLALLVAGLVLSSCASWHGIANVSMPGGPGSGAGAYTVYVQMPDTLALNDNSRVRVADVFVGTVRGITLKNWVATLALSLDKSVKLPSNATAKIGQTSLLGSQHVELARPPNPSPELLKDGDTIPLKNSSAYPTTEQTLASLALILRGGGVPNLEVLQNEAYNILNLVSDIVGLVNALGQERAVIVGHDWGAPVAWTSALIRTDMFRGLGLLSVPYVPRPPVGPAAYYTALIEHKNFYQDYFQEPGKVEKELEADVHRTMLSVLYTGSGDAPAEDRFKFIFEKNQRFADTFVIPDQLPPWLTEQDLAFFTNEFKQTGFRGGINWYRNFQRNWEITPFLDGAKVIRPTVFAAGDLDIVLDMTGEGYKNLENHVANLFKKHLIPGAGHWIQQERPNEINQLLIDFLRSL